MDAFGGILERWGLLFFLGELVIKLAFVAALLLRRDRRGSAPTNLTWILVILAIPVVGIAAYLMVGTVRLGTRRTRQRAELVDRLNWGEAGAGKAGRYPELEVDYRRLAALAVSAGALDPRGGNELELLSGSTAYIDRMIADIDRATHHCHVLSYIFLDDGSGRRLSEALLRAAERGVVCRVLVDAVGPGDFLDSALRRRLAAGNVHVAAALPVSFVRAAFARLDLRNHRKLAIVDGAVGYTGSQNVSDAEFAPKPASRHGSMRWCASRGPSCATCSASSSKTGTPTPRSPFMSCSRSRHRQALSASRRRSSAPARKATAQRSVS